jgi:hypothetical protein
MTKEERRTLEERLLKFSKNNMSHQSAMLAGIALALLELSKSKEGDK